MFFKKHPRFTGICLTGLLAVGISTAVVTTYVKDVLKDTPTITEDQLESEATWNIYDVNGNIIASQTNTKRQYIKYNKIPQLYIDTLLSVEDKDYFTEKGFSPKRFTAATVSYIKSKITHDDSNISGGSTITQQLIKNVAYSTLSKDRTVKRKIQEIWLSQQLTHNWSKQQVLEWYINKINMGEGSYGADTIAYTYYGKHLYELSEKTPSNISKLAIIAGLGQAPSTYNLYDNPDGVKTRRNTVLQMMLKNKVITKKEYKKALKIDVTQDLKERYWQNTQTNQQISDHNAYITSVLKQVKTLGYDLDTTPLQIYTYLDPNKDTQLQNIVSNPAYYKNEGQQAAVTVTDPQTGNIIAQSGSRYQSNEEPYAYNRATQRSRSSGSTIKPFIDYGPAIEYYGLGSGYTLDSSPYTYPGTSITAQNYGGYTYGIVDMKKALRLSLNTPAIRILDNVVGSDAAKQFLSKLNMDVKDSYGGADALGLDLSTEDFAAGFATIANGGIYRSPNYISKLVFSDGSEKEIKSTEIRAMKESTAYILAKILEGTTQDGYSATSAKIPEYAGYLVKTGTVGYDTADGVYRPDLVASDSWMSGSTKSIAVSVWTGYDSPNEPNNWIDADQTTRADIFVAIMKTFNTGKDTSDFSTPSTVSTTGSGFTANYTPTDKTTTYRTLTFPNLITSENILADATKAASVESDTSAWKIPDSYQDGSWHQNLNDDDAKIYSAWESNANMPTLKSIIDDKTWYNIAN